MSSIPPVPPAAAAAAGAVGTRDSKANATNQSASTGQSIAIEASAEGGDRDADGRDLREHHRPQGEETFEQAIEEASGADERGGGLDVSV